MAQTAEMRVQFWVSWLTDALNFTAGEGRMAVGDPFHLIEYRPRRVSTEEVTPEELCLLKYGHDSLPTTGWKIITELCNKHQHLDQCSALCYTEVIRNTFTVNCKLSSRVPMYSPWFLTTAVQVGFVANKLALEHVSLPGPWFSPAIINTMSQYQLSPSQKPRAVNAEETKNSHLWLTNSISTQGIWKYVKINGCLPISCFSEETEENQEAPCSQQLV